MNKVKSVLVVALVLAVVAPCFGNNASIKRKKNKWVQSTEQQALDSTDKSQETAEAF
ncbi:hypothetical protein LJC72_00800 [Bacteroides sp. OttesenSCG-928-D19]|nr:hypothetical protein [Bacteroides sp. OttesenSCG-928-D19]